MARLHVSGRYPYLAARWQGTWNLGLEQDLQILGIGCAYPAGAFGGQALTWRQMARRQMLASFAPSRRLREPHLRPCQDSPLLPAFLDPLTDRHPPIVPTAFSKLDTVAVLTARLLPAPDAF
jgi:hypothetical protein